MTFFILGLACALLAIVSASLYRAFSHVTQKELKRRARNGDEVAAILYRFASYGLSTKLVLGSLFALSTYGAFVFMVQALEAWLALPVLVIIAMLGLLFVESEGVCKTEFHCG